MNKRQAEELRIALLVRRLQSHRDKVAQRLSEIRRGPLPRKESVRKGMTIAEAEVELAQIVAAVELDRIRASRESRFTFIRSAASRLIPRVDGRAQRGVMELIITTAIPHAFADRDRCRRLERNRKHQKRHGGAATRSGRGATRRPSRPPRPSCAFCGASQRLLDQSGVCVNRGRCMRRHAVFCRRTTASSPDRLVFP